MPNYTENLNLAKPIPDVDVADIELINENFEKIDKFSKIHNHDERYLNEKQIEEKFKNFCPKVVGELLLLESTDHPAVLYPGTTWQKITERFIYASDTPGATGGSKKITVAQMPLHEHPATQVAHEHSKGTMNVTGVITHLAHGAYNVMSASGAFVHASTGSTGGVARDIGITDKITLEASKSWTGSTTSAQPIITIESAGGGEDYMPPYYGICIWKRLS